MLEHYTTRPFYVLKVGVEPTCNQLPFLHGISVRGYLSIFVLTTGFEPVREFLLTTLKVLRPKPLVDASIFNNLFQYVKEHFVVSLGLEPRLPEPKSEVTTITL